MLWINGTESKNVQNFIEAFYFHFIEKSDGFRRVLIFKRLLSADQAVNGDYNGEAVVVGHGNGHVCASQEGLTI